MDFICPKCAAELFPVANAKKCALGHSYDRAKEGYYNLLIGSGGGTHGDNREMVRARTLFLSAGHYAPLARRIADIVCELLPRGGVWLDAGCGEGYYTSLISEALSHRFSGVCDQDTATERLLAFDVSKDAVRVACKRCAGSFAVASSYSIPLCTESVDMVLNVFSPKAQSEVSRVLKDNGYLIFVYPDRHHLWELKSVLYDTPYENEPEVDMLEGFETVLVEEVRFTVSMHTPEEIGGLFLMTPYAYRTPKSGRERLEKLTELDTRVEFRIAVYRKKETL